MRSVSNGAVTAQVSPSCSIRKRCSQFSRGHCDDHKDPCTHFIKY